MAEIIKLNQEGGGLVKYTPQEFLRQYNPATVEENYPNITSVVSAIRADNYSLALSRKDLGSQTVCDVISLHLVTFCQSINVHQSFTSKQIEELSSELVKSFWWISVVEVAYVLRRAKRGDFGTFKYAINMADVFGWFNQYNDERCIEFQKSQEAAHLERKNGKVVQDPETGKLMTEFLQEFDDKQRELLSSIKDSLPKSKKVQADENYAAFKKQIEQHGVESTLEDVKESEELKEMKRQILERYGN